MVVKNKDLKKKLIQEFKVISHIRQPLPKKNWDLIWILTAKELDITENYKTSRNETRDRLETGITLAKNITKIRTKKHQLTLENIKLAGPTLYLSGYNEHNVIFKNQLENNYFEKKYKFPKENIIIGPIEDILHTDHQFEKFPRSFLNENRKIVLITSNYHIPRIKRYLKKYPDLENSGKFLIYSALPLYTKDAIMKIEMDKIIRYVENGILPKELQ